MKSVKNFRYVQKTSAECNEDSYLAILHLSRVELHCKLQEYFFKHCDTSYMKNCNRAFKAMLHGAIFIATCNAILLLRDVKLSNTSLHYTPLMFSQHIENSSLISLINISQE